MLASSVVDERETLRESLGFSNSARDVAADQLKMRVSSTIARAHSAA
jgi:hypothetical protein